MKRFELCKVNLCDYEIDEINTGERMTENKRFTNTDNGFIVDYKSEQKVLNLYDVVDVLNELHDENEQLKQELNAFKPVVFQDTRKGTVILYGKGDV